MRRVSLVVCLVIGAATALPDVSDAQILRRRRARVDCCCVPAPACHPVAPIAAPPVPAQPIGPIASAPVPSQPNWGSIKGQVVWTGNAIPLPRMLVPAGRFPGVGAVFDDTLQIDPATRGVANVMVWLVDASGARLPIHPKLAPIPQKPAQIAWPALTYEPRITMLRAGQPLILVNDSPVVCNARISGNPEVNATINRVIAAGATVQLRGQKALRAEKRPMMLLDDIHGWMSGRIGVFDHPYFALTDENGRFEIKDAPAGDFAIFIQHEKAGWLHTPRERNPATNTGGSKGQPIAIPAGGVKDMGRIELKLDFLR